MFAGKRIWITGASAGIGAGIARAFGGVGAQLILSGRNEAALQQVASDLSGAQVLPFDVTDLDALPAIVERAGVVDVLILNAGVSQRSLCEDTSMDVYRRIMEIDYFAPVAHAKLVLPAMLARGSGHIAVTSSVAGKIGSPQRTAYSSAKHAVMGFFDALRTEVGHRGVNITTIIPGYVRTDIAVNALTADGTPRGPGVDEVDGGISPDEAGRMILEGFQKGVREIPVGAPGGDDMALLDLKREDPDRLLDLMGEMGAAVVRKFRS